MSVLQNITGGPRPMFAQGLAYGQSFPSAYGTFAADPNTPYDSVTGILNKNVLDTTGFTYTIDGDAAATTALNASVQKITPDADANRLRTDRQGQQRLARAARNPRHQPLRLHGRRAGDRIR
ncbi:hypothetical protein [Rhizobacter sp. Root404]|uniref:hypothetical protein n=1 Tax=Rhizobacter sp. Root404 TaxID=1736528 RepID=UPI0006F96AA1|nr:hypothetical protein [Rhizobacter sp. Root404]KQW34241.1 hypothetical protein ASC76_23615 [Rhizobacter sp. Root404]